MGLFRIHSWVPGCEEQGKAEVRVTHDDLHGRQLRMVVERFQRETVGMANAKLLWRALAFAVEVAPVGDKDPFFAHDPSIIASMW